jgi:hypothetical protein
VALPDTNVWRLAEDLPASAVRSVSPLTRRIDPDGTPSASAAIWTITVEAPWPMSTAPEYSVSTASRSRPSSIVEGFVIDVLPMPYHMAPIPTPRRSGCPWDAATAL